MMHMNMRLFTNLFYILLLRITYFTIVYSNDDPFSNTLLSVLQKASGVFKNLELQKGLEHTVLVTGCNYGFINHLFNFKCYADRLGLKFIVIALDDKAYQYLSKHTDIYTYYMAAGSDNTTATLTSESTNFRSKQFNLITARKKEAVHDILVLGYNVLFSDTDVAIVKDPLPYMLWKNVDYVHTLNVGCGPKETWNFRKSKEEGNTGLYYVRSNNRTIKMWGDAFEAVPRYPGLDDQAVFWKVIRNSVNPPVVPLKRCRDVINTPTSVRDKKDKHVGPIGKKEALVTCFLDSCAFSSAMLSRTYVPEYTYETLIENLGARNETMITLHANYLSGNEKKMLKMKEHGFWLPIPPNKEEANESNKFGKGCLPFIPTNGVVLNPKP